MLSYLSRDVELPVTCCRLLEVVPVPMADNTGVWAKLVYPLLVHGAHKVRDRAMVAVEMGLTAMMQHQAEFSKNLEEDLKTVNTALFSRNNQSV